MYNPRQIGLVGSLSAESRAIWCDPGGLAFLHRCPIPGGELERYFKQRRIDQNDRNEYFPWFRCDLVDIITDPSVEFGDDPIKRSVEPGSVECNLDLVALCGVFANRQVCTLHSGFRRREHSFYRGKLRLLSYTDLSCVNSTFNQVLFECRRVDAAHGVEDRPMVSAWHARTCCKSYTARIAVACLSCFFMVYSSIFWEFNSWYGRSMVKGCS